MNYQIALSIFIWLSFQGLLVATTQHIDKIVQVCGPSDTSCRNIVKDIHANCPLNKTNNPEWTKTWTTACSTSTSNHATWVASGVKAVKNLNYPMGVQTHVTANNVKMVNIYLRTNYPVGAYRLNMDTVDLKLIDVDVNIVSRPNSQGQTILIPYSFRVWAPSQHCRSCFKSLVVGEKNPAFPELASIQLIMDSKCLLSSAQFPC